MAKICPACGGESPDNASFCIICGTRHEQVRQPEEPAASAEAGSTETQKAAAEERSAVAGLPETRAPEEAGSAPYPAEAQSEKNEADACKAEPGLNNDAAGEGEPVSPPQPALSEPAQEQRSPAETTIDLIKETNCRCDEPAPPKKSKYAPMSSIGTALSLVAMGIPVIGFIITVVWACGACRKIGRRNLARAMLILMGLGIILWIVAALLIRYVYADDITRAFESLFPGYTINWG
jgi:hypothetical protein